MNNKLNDSSQAEHIIDNGIMTFKLFKFHAKGCPLIWVKLMCRNHVYCIIVIYINNFPKLFNNEIYM